MSRSAELLRTTPICVLYVTAFTVSVYLLQISQENIEHNFTMFPRGIIFQHQFYRILTSSFLHGGIFHIVMNMMSFFSLGAFLERSFGTLWHFSTILWSVILVNCTYVFISFTMYICGKKDIINTHALGFSGTLFHLVVLQCHLSTFDRSVFGTFQVSSKVYPWILLIGIQVVMPNVSFLGHLSGILVGEMHRAGLLNWILPSTERLRSVDGSNMLQRIASKNNYIKTPSSDDLFDTTFSRRQSQPLSHTFVTLMSVLCKFVKDVAKTLKVIIFGRGQEMNDNIRLNEAELTSLGAGIGDVDDIGEGGEWAGLEHPEPRENELSECV